MNSTLQGDKYLWLLPQSDDKVVLDIAKSYNLSIPICQTLYTRGFLSKEQINSFLFSSFEQDVNNPKLMKDLEKAVDRVIQAIEKQEKILVCGDYDVDGITSSAMMMLCLSSLGAKINFFLPHRVNDGYGLSVKVVQKAAANDYKVIITVDNGITAFDPAKRAKELAIDLIITDHHRPHDHVPDAFAIVDPNQIDCQYPFKYLAGVGVTFKFLSLLYEKKGLKLPQKAYELLLLGTIADVVPLLGENRFWVRHGLLHVNKHESLSFKFLKLNGKFTKPKISASDIGFNITPQINALGRLEDARQGVKFLIGTNEQEISEIGNILCELNQTRKEIERTIFLEIVAEIKSKKIDLEKEKIILAASYNWPPGVIGLVASRLVSEYSRPVLLFHLTNDGYAKGSCRSISAFNMFDSLNESKDLLEKFGGHSQAAGLSLKIQNLPILKNRLEELIATKVTEFDLKKKLNIDAQASLTDLSGKFISDLEYLEPFGHHNDRPSFYIKNVSLVQKPTLLKDSHLKCQIFADGIIKPIIFFNRPDLFEKLLNQADEPFDIAVQITENHWNGKTNIELLGLDIANLKKW
jgi:single-stranded-DNA-specific exonuclease